MTEPGLTPEERAARIGELQGEADNVMGNLRAKMAAVAQAQQTALAATGEATSQDGSVRVTVDATGVVTDLQFSDSAFQKLTPQRLAAATVATIQSAATKARSQMQQTLAPLADVSALRAARDNVPGLESLTVPPVPHTATDPGEGFGTEHSAGYAFEQQQVEPEEEPPPPPAPSQVRRPRPTAEDEDFDEDGSIYR